MPCEYPISRHHCGELWGILMCPHNHDGKPWGSLRAALIFMESALKCPPVHCGEPWDSLKCFS